MNAKSRVFEYFPKAKGDDLVLIERAYFFAKNAHEGQSRYTGEPYFSHCLETAKTLGEWNMDATTISAGLLHDVLEDAHVSGDDLRKEFGETITDLVEGVTKLGALRYYGIERHVESLRKFFMATAEDIRILMIKLADRLHNAKTLHGHTNPEKQKRIALETIELYAPLANRLGMGELRGQLEDAAFPYAHKEEYEHVKKLLSQKTKKDKKYLAKVHRSLVKELAKHEIVYESADYRIKHAYSLYKKLLRYDMNIDKIHDIVALRIIVDSIEDCYRVLGIVHSMWKPFPERVKDYIATPKTNGYQSLHTTIFTGDGGIAEIQIRTRQMHLHCEFGVASHITYKDEEDTFARTVADALKWLAQLSRFQKGETNEQYLNQLKKEFFESSIFVLTPKGDVIELPDDGTVIDFAYAIHSDIGDHASAARVNGKYSPLDYTLSSGDIVEVETRRASKPTKKWLDFAKTNLARRHIRSFLRESA